MDAIIPHPGIGGAASYKDAWGTKGIRQIADDTSTVDHQHRTLYTGAELMARLRGLPEHLRPGQVER